MPFRLLLIEESQTSASELIGALQGVPLGGEVTVLATQEALASALDQRTWDGVIVDNASQRYDNLEILALVRGRQTDVPVIFISHACGEEAAVDLIRAGAADCVMKTNLARLAGSVERAVVEAAARRQQRQAEELMRANEEQLRLLFEGVRDFALIMLDTEGRIHTWNAAAQRILGYEAREVLGQHVSVLYPEEDVKLRKPDLFLKVAHAEGRYEEQGWRLRRDRSQVWAGVFVTPLYEGEQLRGYALLLRDLTDQRAREQIEHYHDQLRSVVTQMMANEEEERRRICTDLHDFIGQAVVASKLKLAELRKLSPAPEARELVEGIDSYLDETVRCTRSLIFELSPPVLHELGLEAALEWLGEKCHREFGYRVTVENDEEPKLLEEEVKVLLFRIVRELMTNVAKHARAKEVRVSLTRHDEKIHVEVIDDGVGCDPGKVFQPGKGPRGYGLFSIRDRLAYIGGSLEITSEPQRGTRILLTAPLRKRRASSRRPLRKA